jgi:prepilin-type N-terminal cleavage/methylation domain-containing protein
MIEWANRAEQPPKGGIPTGYRAFSLIEMLVVIAIIGMLAAILLGVLPGVMHRKVMARVQTELTQLQNAIDYYKEKNGFYPPDNTTIPKDLALRRPPLFYELVGTTHNGNNYSPLNGEPSLSSAEITNVFGALGFVNSGEAGEVQNFYPTLKSSQYEGDPSKTNVLYLTVPAKGPDGEFNTWRYIVAKPNPGPVYPTNNPTSYDLWAEVAHGGTIHVIGNWKK